MVERANFSGSESSLRMWRAGVEDSAIIGDDSVMIGGLTGVVGSIGRVGSTSGASGGFCCCCSSEISGTSAAGAGFMGGLFNGRFCCSKPLLMSN